MSAGGPDGTRGVRHARSHPSGPFTTGASRFDLRPLDRVRSLRVKLGVLVAATVTATAFVTWIGLQTHLGPSRTLPLAVFAALVITQLLAHGMTSPLREMTAAARAMAQGDYSRRVQATGRDEVGQLAAAFNAMAADLGSVDELRREMIANVSHELRTPVAALRAQLENMVDGVEPADAETLGSALAQTERLGRLVGSLLDLSRLEAGAVGLDLTSVPLQDFLTDVVEGARLAAEATGRDVHWEVTTTPPDLRVEADPERLHQVVRNLADNAARHSPPDGTVRVSARYEPGPEDVVIDVGDEGHGIAPEDRERVFERFHRGLAPAHATGQRTGGTGLGLAIARWAVTLHGGTIAVADRPGPGATLRVRLPARRMSPREGSDR
jgi:signal transduction histidine kinase